MSSVAVGGSDLYVTTFKELIDEVIEEYSGDPKKVRDLIKVVLIEAKKVLTPQ